VHLQSKQCSGWFGMGCAQHIARANEAGPLSLAWTSYAVGDSIVAYHQTGSDRRQQLREFEDLPSRTVGEALKHPVADPRLCAVDTGGYVQLGNPQRALASNRLFLEAILPALCLTPAP
jgi:hypothetical protein